MIELLLYCFSMEIIICISEILFWLSIFMILYTYLIYPLLLWFISHISKGYFPASHRFEDLTFVSIIIPAYNEEGVIGQKIESILSNNFPRGKYEILIGSDASTDNTDSIIKEYSIKYPFVKLTRYPTRQGKPNIINDLVKRANSEIVILTDANVFFTKNTIFELSKYFKDKEIGLVDANMVNTGMRKSGISFQENTYITHEVKLKNREGLIWGMMMGPFGGCFAISKKCYSQIPMNFLVDDFYLNMKVLEKGYKAINNLNAVVHENVSHDPREEFRRKVRISSGNFQNLSYFKSLLFSKIRGLSFCFISHKVIRWFVPFFILLAFITNLVIINKHWIYLIGLSLQLAIYIIPIIDVLLRKIKIDIVILRFVTHFINMNLALFTGFIKYAKGIKTNVWEPTTRNQ